MVKLIQLKSINSNRIEDRFVESTETDCYLQSYLSDSAFQEYLRRYKQYKNQEDTIVQQTMENWKNLTKKFVLAFQIDSISILQSIIVHLFPCQWIGGSILSETVLEGGNSSQWHKVNPAPEKRLAQEITNLQD